MKLKTHEKLLNLFFWFVGVGLLIFITVLFVHTKNIMKYRDRLINQCLADGKKEYECVGVLRGRQ